MAVSEEKIQQAIKFRDKHRGANKSRARINRRLNKEIPEAVRLAVASMNRRGWPGAEYERVQVWKFPLKTGSKRVRLIQLRGMPFDGDFNAQRYRLDVGESVWLGDDGKLYTINLALFDARPGDNPAPFAEDAFGVDVPETLLAALRALTM